MAVPTESMGKATSEQYQEMKAQDFSFDAPPTAVGLDESSRPSVDSVITDDMLPPPVQSQSYMSYEDRRRQNREEYEKKKHGFNQPTPPPAPAPFAPPAHFEDSAPTSTFTEAAPKSQPSYRKIVKKNEYGDTWED